MDEFLIASLFITLYSVVQSVFGIGLLAFGTPTFLLLGYSFPQVLLMVLPCSLLISILQLRHGWSELDSFKRDFLIYCVPAVAIALLWIMLQEAYFNLKPLIGSMLIIGGVVRFSSVIKHAFQTLVERLSKPYLVVMGALHGATNLGGALLAIYVSVRFHTKEEIRAHIAFAYTAFATTQLSILGGTAHQHFSAELLLFPLLSLSAYRLFGNRVFQAASQKAYLQGMGVFMLVFRCQFVPIRLVGGAHLFQAADM